MILAVYQILLNNSMEVVSILCFNALKPLLLVLKQFLDLEPKRQALIAFKNREKSDRLF